jgi:hypothetical protein
MRRRDDPLRGIRYGRVATDLGRLGTPPIRLARNFVYVMMGILVMLLVLAIRVLL